MAQIAPVTAAANTRKVGKSKTITSYRRPLGVAVKRYENESENKLRVWLENVPFDKMVRWLDQLETRYGLVIVNIAIDAEKEPGLVTAKLVLQN